MAVYIVVLVFIAFDIITGVMKAVYNKNINSSILRTGLFRKLSEVVALVGAGLLEHGVEYLDINFSLPVLKGCATYICIMEFISILENIGEINPGLGRFLKPYLDKLKHAGGELESGSGPDKGKSDVNDKKTEIAPAPNKDTGADASDHDHDKIL